MKKWIVLILLLFSVNVYAGNLIVGQGGLGVTSAAGEAGCVSGALFTYNGDHTSGTDYACDSAGAGLDGTIVDATVSADYVEFSAVNDYLGWTIDTSEINTSVGTMFCSVYIIDRDTDTNISDAVIFESYNDANNYFKCLVAGTQDEIQCTHVGTGTSSAALSTHVLSFDQWYRIGFSFDAANDTISVQTVELGSAFDWTGGEDAESVDVWASAIDEFRIGELECGSSVNETLRVKDCVFVNGYEASDPME